MFWELLSKSLQMSESDLFSDRGVHAQGRLGVLEIFLDGRRVLMAPLDLSQVLGHVRHS